HDRRWGGGEAGLLLAVGEDGHAHAEGRERGDRTPADAEGEEGLAARDLAVLLLEPLVPPPRADDSRLVDGVVLLELALAARPFPIGAAHRRLPSRAGRVCWNSGGKGPSTRRE